MTRRFAPKVASNKAPLDFITEAIEAAGYKPGTEISLALDPASSEFYSDGIYELKSEGKTLFRRDDRILPGTCK